MKNQTPPVVPVSEDQYAKAVQVLRDIVRKGNINNPEFQHVLGHPDFVKELNTIVTTKVSEYRQKLPLVERPPFVAVPAEWYRKHDSTKKLESATTAAGNQLGDWSRDILRRMTVSGEIPDEDVEFFDASNAELGYPNGCTVAQTCEAGLKLGFELCRPEDGPLVRTAYTEQKLGDWRLMAMDPITDSRGSPGVFSLKRDAYGCWLRGRYGHPGIFYYGSVRWVFRRKRSL